jgi:hypothetical protein
MREFSFFFSGRLEGILIVLQELSVKDGFTDSPTKEYVSQKLTELNLANYIKPIINEFYTN